MLHNEMNDIWNQNGNVARRRQYLGFMNTLLWFGFKSSSGDPKAYKNAASW